MSLQSLAYQIAQSDAAQTFGIRTRIDNKDKLSSPKSWIELGLRISHWFPGFAIAGGVGSLALAGVRIYKKGEASTEDWADVARALLAIAHSTFFLAILDISTTYTRMKGPGEAGSRADKAMHYIYINPLDQRV